MQRKLQAWGGWSHRRAQIRNMEVAADLSLAGRGVGWESGGAAPTTQEWMGAGGNQVSCIRQARPCFVY